MSVMRKLRSNTHSSADTPKSIRFSISLEGKRAVLLLVPSGRCSLTLLTDLEVCSLSLFVCNKCCFLKSSGVNSTINCGKEQGINNK